MTASGNGRRAATIDIFLFGYYGCGNVGDDLLLAVLLEKLLKSASNVRVKCLLAPDIPRDARVTFLELEKILADRSRRAPIRLGLFLIQIWKALRGVRSLIFGGGTLFHASGGAPTNLLILASVAVLARLRGAKVAAIGVGVGKIRGFLPRALLSAILRLSSDFAVRDRSSLDNCWGLGGSDKVRLTADLVFLYPLPPRTPALRLHPTVGLALAASAIGDNAFTLLDPVTGFVELLHVGGWEVVGLSFQELEFQELRLSDSALLQTVCRDRPAIPVRRLEVSGDRIAEAFSALDVVVGMRFHALVLAARLGIPFVGVGRDIKLADLCRRYGFPFFELESLSPDDLLAAVEQVRGSVPDLRVTMELAREATTNFANSENIFSS